MKINPRLIWDYEITDKDIESESFREIYIRRVLVRGKWQDIQDLGLDTIKIYLPKIPLPQDIRRFWEWYFNEGEKYVGSNRFPEKDSGPGFKG